MRIFLFLFAGVAFSQTKFVKDCNVISDAKPNATVLCKKKVGDQVDSVDSKTSGFFEVQMKDCFGFVEASCLKDVKLERKTGSQDNWRSLLGLGISGIYGGTFARAGGENTTGNQYGGALTAIWGPIKLLRIMVSVPQVASMSLTRTVDGSGSLSDSNPVQYTHTLKVWGAKGILGLSLVEGNIEGRSAEAGVALGGEYLVPFKAVQTTTFGAASGTDDEFKTSDRYFFAVLMLFSRFHVTSNFYGGLFGEVTYNLGSKDGANLVAARLGVDLGFDLY